MLWCYRKYIEPHISTSESNFTALIANFIRSTEKVIGSSIKILCLHVNMISHNFLGWHKKLFLLLILMNISIAIVFAI